MWEACHPGGVSMLSEYQDGGVWDGSLVPMPRRGGMDGWTDGRMDGLSIAGGGSLGPRHEALAAQRPYQQALILFGVPVGLAGPRGSGYCEMCE